ncbi:hypothetical protein PSHT_12024 [Puccinia striiformis]|uniref:Uncharacterized protein n=1 Tax=Puccinia striiformis TaxID=27350 RepID=A0A2S4UZC9_9BASI|nr:hypothetical protein PSHT_12024 [Puccinia striiformis]
MGRLAELQRKNLEHLMGAEAMGIIQVDLKFTDPKVCRSYLCGACPHDLFTNTVQFIFPLHTPLKPPMRGRDRD